MIGLAKAVLLYPRRTVCVLGVLGILAGALADGPVTAAIIGLVVLTLLVMSNAERKMYPTPRQQQGNARVRADTSNESAANRTHSTTTTEANHD